MRKLIFFMFIAVGTAFGLAATLNDMWGLRVVMMAIGAVTGAAIGGAITGVVTRGRAKKDYDSATAPESGMTSADLMDNHWRDKGRPPLTSALEPEHGRHQFDPDKL